MRKVPMSLVLCHLIKSKNGQFDFGMTGVSVFLVRLGAEMVHKALERLFMSDVIFKEMMSGTAHPNHHAEELPRAREVIMRQSGFD